MENADEMKRKTEERRERFAEGVLNLPQSRTANEARKKKLSFVKFHCSDTSVSNSNPKNSARLFHHSYKCR